MSVELLSKLSERFPVDDVKQRRQGGRMLDYISIDATIRRLNDVLGNDWSFDISEHSIDILPSGGYLAVVRGRLDAIGKSAAGVGADMAPDPDKALKTALAEALKKAGHQFGIGLYLWDEAEREVVAKQRKKAETVGEVQDSVPAGTNVFGSGSF